MGSEGRGRRRLLTHCKLLLSVHATHWLGLGCEGGRSHHLLSANRPRLAAFTMPSVMLITDSLT